MKIYFAGFPGGDSPERERSICKVFVEEINKLLLFQYQEIKCEGD